MLCCVLALNCVSASLRLCVKSPTCHVVILLWALLLLTACRSPRPKSSPPSIASSARIEQIHLIAFPVALNLDQRPGVDGFGIKIYALSRERPKPFAIRGGAIEVIMYDGLLTGTNVVEPRASWRYSASELPKYEVKGAVGAGYQIGPRWGTNLPLQSRITVIARYHPADGPFLQSAPSIIAIPVR